MTALKEIAKALREALAEHATSFHKQRTLVLVPIEALKQAANALEAQQPTEAECRKVLAEQCRASLGYVETGNYISHGLDVVLPARFALAAMMRLTRPSNGDRDAVLEEAAKACRNRLHPMSNSFSPSATENAACVAAIRALKTKDTPNA